MSEERKAPIFPRCTVAGRVDRPSVNLILHLLGNSFRNFAGELGRFVGVSQRVDIVHKPLDEFILMVSFRTFKVRSPAEQDGFSGTQIAHLQILSKQVILEHCD